MNYIRTSPQFSREFVNLRASWRWVRNDFVDEFDRLSDAGAFRPDGPSRKIWNTRNKFVLRTTTSRGFDVVYKSFYRIKEYQQYYLRPSPSAQEALNYMMLSELGIPLPDLLVVGEIREISDWFVIGGFRRLTNSFLVSRFVEGFRDGSDFIIGGPLEKDEMLMMEFCRGNLAMLAKLHDAGILHRGFTPTNLMYRREPDGMKFCWIDVASCCRASITTKKIADDIINLFRFLEIPGSTRRELEAWYLKSSASPRTDMETLSKVLEKRLVECLKRKNRVPLP